MVQLAGPEGAAMVMVDPNNKITAYISPPGGGGQQDLIKKVWEAYLETKGATPPAAPALSPAPADANDVLRQQAADIANQTHGRQGGGNTMGSTERTVKGTNDAGELVVHDPTLGAAGGTDVAISRDGMKATWVVAANGMPPVKMTAEFEGGDQPASQAAKMAKGAKGVASVIGHGYDTRASGTVDVSGDPDKNWRVISEGQNGTHTTELGGFRQGVMAAKIGDPAQTIATKQLESVKLDLKVAQGYTAADGSAAVVFTSDRSKRGLAALDEITKVYDVK